VKVIPDITGSGHNFELTPQGEIEIELQVRVEKKAKNGNSIDTLVNMDSGAKVDAVLAVTKRK
jgi:hypothetical protein